METHYFCNAATLVLEELFGVHETVHGTMLEVFGEGVLLVGEAGVGKSETALGLLKRGHALVSDDNIMLRRDRMGRIMASPVPPITNFMEIRGIGIIHVPSILGVSAMRGQKQLDLVVSLERSQAKDPDVDRTGNVWAYRNVLGLRVPDIVLIVAAGRDVVNLVETAVCEFKLRVLGTPSGKRLDELIMKRNEQLAQERPLNAEQKDVT
jgi:HPr kinase/phosphorylase